MNQNFRLFFAPYLANPFDLFFYVLRVTVFTLFGGIMLNYLLASFSNRLVNHQVAQFEQLVYGFLIAIALYGIFVVSIRHFGGPSLRAHSWKYLHTRYLPIILSLENNYADTLGAARIFSIFDKGGQAWVGSLNTLFEQGVRLLIVGVPTFYILFQQNLTVIGTSVGILILTALYTVFLNSKLKLYKQARIKAVTEYDRRIIRSIHSRLEIVQSLAVGQEIEALDQRNEAYRQPSMRQGGMQMMIYQGVRMMAYVVLASIYWNLGHSFLNGEIPLQTLIFLAGLIGTLSGLLFDLSSAYIEMSDAIASIEQLWNKIDLAPKIKNLFTGIPFLYKKGEIRFENVSLHYIENREVISDFSFTFKSCQKYALVGPSGGGKTTLMKLACGFLAPTRGKVTVDGVDLQEVNLSTFYPTLGYLTQEPQVFDGTIRENLLYGTSTDASEERLAEALEKAEAHFVYDLLHGIDTEIGERWVKLSGGQRQRLAIAKIFLKNPKVILLDEPTSALDSISEESITRAFEKLFEGKTVIIVAHRLKTVQQADTILVVEGGKIVESGTHDELQNMDGSYARMLRAQTHF